MIKDDEDWIELMRGANVPDAAAETKAEVAHLRATIQAAREAAALLPPERVAAAWERLEATAMREGLVPAPAATTAPTPTPTPTPTNAAPVSTPSSSPGGAGEPRRRTPQFWAGMSALGAALAAMIYVGLMPAWRGGDEVSAPPIFAPDPQAEARALHDELLAVGAQARVETVDPQSGATKVHIDVGSAGQPGDPVATVLDKHKVERVKSQKFSVLIRPGGQK